jgi:hypothetical protein
MSTPYKEALITGTIHMLCSSATINNNVVIDLPVFTEYTSPVSIEQLSAALSSSKSAHGGGGGQEYLWSNCQLIQDLMSNCIQFSKNANVSFTNNEKASYFGNLLLKKLISVAVRASANCVSKRISKMIQGGIGVTIRSALHAFSSHDR